ncbi:MAG: pyruvate formate lyase family protein, partial [Clostridia bacterium]|nr:pyruvate formate lyase family protein [Clostridia bacterium]
MRIFPLPRESKALETEYTSPVFQEETGLSYDALTEKCRGIYADEAVPFPLRKAAAMRLILEEGQLALYDEDVFADRLNCAFASSSPSKTVEEDDRARQSILVMLREERLAALRQGEMKPVLAGNAPALSELLFTGDVDFGHTCPDWRAVLSLGVPGLLGRVRAFRETDPENLLYRSAEEVLEAFLVLIGRFEALAREKGREELAACLSSLGSGAPGTLYEAMELSFLYYLVQHTVEGENLRSLGNPDGLLGPFLEKDLTSGVLGEEDAENLVDRYLYKWSSMKIQANIPFYLAGSDAEGHDKSNAMTRLILREYERLGLYDPKIHIRVTGDTPRDVTDTVLRLIREGKNSFVFMNDRAVEKALSSLGESPEDARDYVIIGCYEPASAGREVPCTCNGRLNLLKALEVTLTGGYSLLSGKAIFPAEPFAENSFDALVSAYLLTLSRAAVRAAEQIAAYERFYPSLNPAPLLSATYEDCLRKGTDVYSGGAKYNNSSISAFGLADAVDSLLSIRKLVYEEKALTLPALLVLLKNDWRDAELFRLRIRKDPGKYGNGLPESEKL